MYEELEQEKYKNVVVLNRWELSKYDLAQYTPPFYFYIDKDNSRTQISKFKFDTIHRVHYTIEDWNKPKNTWQRLHVFHIDYGIDFKTKKLSIIRVFCPLKDILKNVIEIKPWIINNGQEFIEKENHLYIEKYIWEFLEKNVKWIETCKDELPVKCSIGYTRDGKDLVYEKNNNTVSISENYENEDSCITVNIVKKGIEKAKSKPQPNPNRNAYTGVMVNRVNNHNKDNKNKGR